MKSMKKLLVILAFAPAMAVANTATVPLDKAPVDLTDDASLQRGAKVFVNYCLNCHSASAARYNRMQDFGLTEQQIKDNLLFAAEKPGELMNVAMPKADAKKWLGAAPPDLSLIARSRGSDWIYTYLRGFYRDPSRPTGWNNTVFDKVGMPHVLWDLQGVQEPVYGKNHEGHEVIEKLTLVEPGSATPAEYDAMVGDLVNYLTWMGEPAAVKRKETGLIVMAFLAFFFVVAYYLKKEFWKDIH